MKISEFSNKYNVSNDTVRYYMKLNLIVPQKKGGHYIFDKDCEKEIKEILRLKDMGFTLQEIKKIFYFKRIGKLTSFQRNNYYQSLYKEKIQEIKEEIKQLQSAKVELKEKIEDLQKENYDNKITMGIGLDSLSLFACPDCKNELALSAEKVIENNIIEGTLSCSCGVSLKIKKGILYSNNVKRDKYISEINEIESEHIEDYIKTTDPDFMDESYQSMDWLKQEMDKLDLKDKIILEPGTGYGYFLRQIYNELPKSAYYICIDNKPHLNRYLKRILEMTGKKSNIIFITADLPKLPIKDKIIDVLVDFTGTSVYCFENEKFLPSQLDRYLKEEIIMLATFIIYRKFGSKNEIDRSFRKNFIYREVKNMLIDQGLEIILEYKSKSQKIKESMGKYEDFAKPGDEIHSYQVKARRWS